MNNIGLCGAHRTGKTTLAITLAKSLNMPFVPINTAEVFARFHESPKSILGIRLRLEVQEAILQKACDIWFEMDTPFISDRTTIDMAAYTLADIKGDTIISPDTEFWVQQYLGNCRKATEKYFSYLVLIPPAIPIIPAAGKASLSKGYIEHVHTLCAGLWCDRHELISGAKLPREAVDLGDRVKFVESFYYGKKGRSYRNKKTGDVYQVSDITRDSEDPTIERVCYSRNGQQSWDRPLDLFVEKFEEV